MKRIVLLLAVLVSLPSLWANDNYRCRNITMNDGLSSNTVRNIVQDDYGFIWFGTDNGLCRYDGVKMQHYRISELGANQYITALLADDHQLYVGTEKGVFLLTFNDQAIRRLPVDIHTTVTSLAKDEEDGLWISTFGQGVWQYLHATGKTNHYDIKDADGTVAQVYVDHSNQVWTITNWGFPAIQRLNRLHNKFEPQSPSPLASSASPLPYNGLRMLQTRDGQMWIGTWENGLMLLHSDGHIEQVLSPALAKVGRHIHSLYQLADDRICIGCDEGAVCFNPKTREWSHLLEYPGLKTRFVYAVTDDKEGGLWIGTFYGGVNYISPVGKRFEAFSMDTGLPGNVISRFCEDRQGRVWVASDDGGLMCYQPQEQRFVGYPHQDVLSRLNAHALCSIGDELWIGTYTSGVYVLNAAKGSLRQYMQTTDPHSLDNSSSYAIHCDRRGRIWVATMLGLNRYDPSQDRFDRIAQTDDLVIDIDEDSEGNLWLTTQGSGMWKYLEHEQRFVTYRHDANDGHSLPNDLVNCTIVDESGRLWIGTIDGLCLFDQEKNRFERIRLDVPNHNIMGIVEDQGALWLSTERGIVRYEPNASSAKTTKRQNSQTTRFTLHDGLVSEQFQPNSAMKASDGRIFFGSASGFNTFYPYQIKANSVMPPVYITALTLMGPNEQTTHSLNSQAIKELELDYSEARMLTVSFASLSYCSPEKNQYAYRLEGFDRDWNYVDNQNRATYTNIPSGTYTFRVKATNNDGIWSDHEATLHIVIHPPFWWSWWARLLYLLLIVAVVWYYVHARLKRAERKHRQEMERLSEEKEKEVRDARLNFFTMIAHEIRTPVSLIIGPLEQIKKEWQQSPLASHTPKTTDGAESPIASHLEVIDRNAHRLLELVNQLLDFRKVEQQQLVMHFAPQNIYDIVQSVSVRFEPTFSQGGKRFTVDCEDRQLTAIVDREAITKVISNLLTNAVKYTKDEVLLACQIDPGEELFRIVVTDNGVGIREEDQKRIFDPFFQAQGNKPGTGIGLNIVRNIVEQHHGTISVTSELGKGSSFVVTLPISQPLENLEQPSEPQPNDAASPTYSEPQHEEASTQLPVVLVVDDSADMVEFLSASLRQHYRIVTAGDGVEALRQLSQHEASIIISDVMMPRMDGTEFCRQVRRNPMTSHIPFVMLTAKTDDDSKVAGMDVGADAYIEKPFSVQYLEACIRNMLDQRRRLIEKFSTQPLEPVTEIASNPTDNVFLTKMNKVIEENFSNPELNVNFLAEQLNISRSGLFAKIKTLADITPNEMIQVVRLKRAAHLLQENKYSVSQVGYMVGFSNPSYFSKCFFKQFGIRPMDYMKQKASQ